MKQNNNYKEIIKELNHVLNYVSGIIEVGQKTTTGNLAHNRAAIIGYAQIVEKELKDARKKIKREFKNLEEK